MILAVRTDKPEAELYLLEGTHELDREIWYAHRELSDTLLEKIEQLLERSNQTKQDIQGIIVFQGPGSFTGLRIGITVANALAYSLNIPVAGAKSENWLKQGIGNLQGHKNYSKIALPHYGGEVHITQPRK